MKLIDTGGWARPGTLRFAWATPSFALAMLSVAATQLLALTVAFDAVACSAVACNNVCGQAETSTRSTRGLVALYEFSETEGEWVRDTSGRQPPVDLKLEQVEGGLDPLHSPVVRRFNGRLRVAGPVLIASPQPATRLIAAAERTGELTIEAWVTPRSLDQQGPARIVTLSADRSHRNVTLGQDVFSFDARLRTTRTSDNGIPSLTGERQLDRPRRVHVVYTRSRDGISRLYLDGELDREAATPGSMSNWDADYRLGLANELTGDRPWEGTLHLVAVYARALTSDEVQQHFQAGPEAEIETSRGDLGEVLFEQQVAPLLAEHCLECHDAANRAGGLDLSHKQTAFRGNSGTTIEAGQAEASLLLQRVLDGSMPEDRPPLSAEKQKLLRQWIDQGATWTFEFIDPALYVHGIQEQSRWVRRLTVEEYINTVRATTGVDISREAYELLPSDLRADGFANTAYNLNVDLAHVEAYAELARRIVQRMDIQQFAKRFAKRQRFTDQDMGALIEAMGRWLLRGPLGEREVIAYRGIATSVAASGGSYETAVGFIAEAMLQSPRFIYLMENQVGDGSSWPVSPFELANRMSYLIWGAPPDEELFQLAQSGELMSAAVLQQQVDRMLQDRRARRQAWRFAAQWLNLGALKNLRPSPQRFTDWNAQLAEDMQVETLAFFDHVAWQEDRPLTALLTTEATFLTGDLATHYGLPVPEDSSAARPLKQELVRELRRVVRGSVARGAPVQAEAEGEPRLVYQVSLEHRPERGGLLTQGSVLTVGGDDASTVTRGLFVLHQLLRGVVKDPPPCVDTTPQPAEPGMSRRDLAITRINNASCGGCHMKFEPLAFALERYDGLGSYAVLDEHGNTQREDGEILFPGTGEPVAYESIREFNERLAGHQRVAESFTWKLAQFALGRPLTAADAESIREVQVCAQQEGGSYREIVRALVTSDLIQMAATEPPVRDDEVTHSRN